MSPVTRTLTFCTLFLFLLFSLWLGMFESLRVHTYIIDALTEDRQQVSSFKGLPDFGQYVPHRTIFEEELDIEHRRVIIVGDIHGMKTYLNKLLDALSYSPSDLLVHLGDTIFRGPDSLSTLQQLTDANVTGVRGNHEQNVIEWRGWIEWVRSQKGGEQWLRDREDSQTFVIESRRKSQRQNLKWPIPKGWKFMDEHYRIARSLTAAQYSYLKSLPLVIHMPSLHTHLVHAGILPFDPMLSPTHPEQPLAHVPEAVSQPIGEEMRIAQEKAILTDIDPNTDPWVLLNMRSILHSNRVTSKSKKGTPWTDLWDMTMKRCKGYHNDGITSQSDYSDSVFKPKLQCFPINVVYGHAAGRGLDIKQWSFGLDTGCAYSRNLTALIITNSSNPVDVKSAELRDVPFGDYGSAQLFSIPCS